MLKGIPKCISPELLKVLAEMGHGDTLVVADAFYPAASNAKNCKLVRADGISSTEMLDAILTLFPLDAFSEKPFIIMDMPEKYKGKIETPVWDEYIAIVEKHDSRGRDAVGFIERFSFYEEAKKAYAILATGEEAYFGCVIIKKGTK